MWVVRRTRNERSRAILWISDKSFSAPARMDPVVDLFDDEDRPFRNGIESRGHGQDSERAVREERRLSGNCFPAEGLVNLDHHLVPGSLDVRDVGDVLLGKRTDELKNLALLALFFRETIKDGGQSRAVSLEPFLLGETVGSHLPRIRVEKEHRGKGASYRRLLRQCLGMPRSEVFKHGIKTGREPLDGWRYAPGGI